MDRDPHVEPPLRRFPYSRAFALAGFSPLEAERWRAAGWHDAEAAARWRHVGAWCPPETLRPLADDGADPARVEAIVRFEGPLTVAELRHRLAAHPGSAVDLDLRERVLENLRRPYGPAPAPSHA